MARPLDFSTDLSKEDSIRFVKELIRVDSLSPQSREMVGRKKFLQECLDKANEVGWKS